MNKSTPRGRIAMSDTTPSVSIGCFGCATSVLGLILLVWLLTHISVVWVFLDHATRVQ